MGGGGGMEEIWDYNYIIFIVLKLKHDKNSIIITK